MRRILLTAGIILLMPLMAPAQDPPKAEISGGFSLLRAVELSSVNFYGWDASVAGNLNRWFGLVGDFSGHYAKAGPGFLGPSAPRVNAHTFLFGPRFSYRSDGRLTPFAHVLFGAAHGSAGVFGVTLSDTAFAMAAGGGIDIRLADRIALRAFQADYLMTRFGGVHQNSVRLTIGMVFRFGQ